MKWDGMFAERRGLRKVYHTTIETFLAPGPEWKDIILR